MRILASAILISLALNIPLSGKAEAAETVNQNTKQISKNNESDQNENQAPEPIFNGIASVNNNFITAIYFPHTAVDLITIGKISAKKHELRFLPEASSSTPALIRPRLMNAGKATGSPRVAKGSRRTERSLAPSSIHLAPRSKLMGWELMSARTAAELSRQTTLISICKHKKEAFAFGRRNLIASIVLNKENAPLIRAFFALWT